MSIEGASAPSATVAVLRVLKKCGGELSGELTTAAVAAVAHLDESRARSALEALRGAGLVRLTEAWSPVGDDA